MSSNLCKFYTRSDAHDSLMRPRKHFPAALWLSLNNKSDRKTSGTLRQREVTLLGELSLATVYLNHVNIIINPRRIM